MSVLLDRASETRALECNELACLPSRTAGLLLAAEVFADTPARLVRTMRTRPRSMLSFAFSPPDSRDRERATYGHEPH